MTRYIYISSAFASLALLSSPALSQASALETITAKQTGQILLQPGRALVQVPPASADRPDVFNSVALSIERNSLQKRWNQVSRAGVRGAAAVYASSLSGEDLMARLEAVNSYVNTRVRYVGDRAQFGVEDRWMTATETLGRGRGDCEDFAIAKRAMLRATGVADRDLYLVVLNDVRRRADHAVLVVRANGRFLVLDNGTNRIVDSSTASYYKPIVSFTAGGSYTHGYRVKDMAPSSPYLADSTGANSSRHGPNHG